MKILSVLLETLFTNSAINKQFISAYIIKHLGKKKKIRTFFAALDEIKDTDKQQHAIEAILTLDSHHFQQLIAILLEIRETDDYLRGNDILAKIIERSIGEEEYKKFIINSIPSELTKKLLTFADNPGSPSPISENEINDIKKQLIQAFDKIFNNLSKQLPEKAKLICVTIYEDLVSKYSSSSEKNSSVNQTIRALFLNRFIAPVFMQAIPDPADEKLQVLYLRILPMTAQGFSTVLEKKDNLVIPQPCKELAFDEAYRKKIDEQFKLLSKHQPIKKNKIDAFNFTSDNLFISLIDQAKKQIELCKKDMQSEIDDIEDKLKLISYRLTSIGKPLPTNTATALSTQEITAIKIRFENQQSDTNVSLINGIRLSGLKTEFSKLQSNLNSKKDEQLKAIQLLREFISDLEKMVGNNKQVGLITQSPETKRMVRERSNTVITPGSNEHKEILNSLMLAQESSQTTDSGSNTNKQHMFVAMLLFFGSTTPPLPAKFEVQPRKSSEPSSLPTVIERKKSVPSLKLKQIKKETLEEKSRTSMTARPQQ